MKMLGIDYGKRKVGFSLSEGWLAAPFGIEANNQDLMRKISDLCQKEKVEKIVVGFVEGKLAEKQKEFGKKIAEVCRLPVDFWDETLTSQAARQKMIESGVKRRKRRQEDAVAAALILQSYLEAQEDHPFDYERK